MARYQNTDYYPKESNYYDYEEARESEEVKEPLHLRYYEAPLVTLAGLIIFMLVVALLIVGVAASLAVYLHL